ncbi:MAG: ABC transporter ATP-binding protein [Desulfovibrionaceae bacterium]|nr:ABC transporter ATP-binding protein [Desulfovibrionaceae bacterium]
MSAPDIVFDGLHKDYTLYASMGHGYKSILTGILQGKITRRTCHRALRGITFSISRGESVGIIGRNGAGKSTLLGLMAGVLKPSSGSVAVNRAVSPMLELGAGFHQDLTGRENILMNGVLLGMRRHEVAEKIESIVEYAELNEFIDQPVRTYSSGMLARLGFSVIVRLDPQILLLDEVFAVGDARFQAKCRASIMEYNRSRNVTTIFVSHNLRGVAELCARCIWIEGGVVRMDGATPAVLDAYTHAME